jgi:prepilin-type N-terminal cleavage/methylation domain-containing protein
MKIKPTNKQSGFTIIELMIASLVFATLLLIITTATIQLSKSYFKGVSQANTQNVARNINTTVSKAIQFSSSVVGPITSTTLDSPNTTVWYCIDNQVFIFSEGVIYSNTSSPSISNVGLISVISPSCPAAATVASLISGGIELLNPNMSVSQLDIVTANAPTNSLYSIDLIVSNAPSSSLLCNNAIGGLAAGSCQPGALDSTLATQLYGPQVKCKYQEGDQYCASASLNNIIALERKLN